MCVNEAIRYECEICFGSVGKLPSVKGIQCSKALARGPNAVCPFDDCEFRHFIRYQSWRKCSKCVAEDRARKEAAKAKADKEAEEAI